MAEFVMGESPLEEIRVCPYDNNHKIKLKSMEAHLEKCRSRNLPKRYQKCPYNPNHVKFVEEMPLHIEICLDLMHFGRQFAIDDAVAPTDKSLATQILMHRNVTGGEDWDDEPEPVTYNPCQKLYETRFTPKNMHQRSEKIYHPDAQLVITPRNNDEPYLSGEGGGAEQGTPYNDDEPIYNSDAEPEDEMLEDLDLNMERVRTWVETAEPPLSFSPFDAVIKSRRSSNASLDVNNLGFSFEHKNDIPVGSTAGNWAPQAGNKPPVALDACDYELAALNGITPRVPVNFENLQKIQEKPSMTGNTDYNQKCCSPGTSNFRGFDRVEDIDVFADHQFEPSGIKRSKPNFELESIDLEFAAMNNY